MKVQCYLISRQNSLIGSIYFRDRFSQYTFSNQFLMLVILYRCIIIFEDKSFWRYRATKITEDLIIKV